MPNFENASDLNNPELNPSEPEVGVNIEKKQEGEPTPKELKKLKTEEKTEVEKSELPSEEQLKNLEDEIGVRRQEIAELTESVEGTKAKLNETREKLGLPPTEENPPSTLSDKEKLEKLQAEKEDLEKQKEELISQQEKERLIQEEKQKVFQEKIEGLFEEFEALAPREFTNVFKTGRTREGRNFESASMGELEPEMAKSLARAFKEGVKLLPKILEALPELLKKFDEDLTKEATERVEQRLEEEKKELKEEEAKEEKPAEEKPEEKPEIPEGKIPEGGIEQEPNPIEGGNVEKPEV